MFYGPFNNAGRVEVTPMDLDSTLRTNSDIKPGQTINGVNFFEYDDPTFISNGKATFRITVRDTAHRETAVAGTPEPADSSDPYAQGGSGILTIKGVGPTLNLSGLQQRRFSGK